MEVKFKTEHESGHVKKMLKLDDKEYEINIYGSDPFAGFVQQVEKDYPEKLKNTDIVEALEKLDFDGDDEIQDAIETLEVEFD